MPSVSYVRLMSDLSGAPTFSDNRSLGMTVVAGELVSEGVVVVTVVMVTDDEERLRFMAAFLSGEQMGQSVRTQFFQ